MIREIKFRALKDDMSNCNFVYGALVYSNGIPRISNDEGLTFHTCLKGTECQFTGLKDKNGVDIYEGDIIECDTLKGRNKMTIQYASHNCYEGFRIYGLNKRFNVPISWSRIHNFNAKVISNIYQNPELLTQN